MDIDNWFPFAKDNEIQEQKISQDQCKALQERQSDGLVQEPRQHQDASSEPEFERDVPELFHGPSMDGHPSFNVYLCQLCQHDRDPTSMNVWRTEDLTRSSATGPPPPPPTSPPFVPLSSSALSSSASPSIPLPLPSALSISSSLSSAPSSSAAPSSAALGPRKKSSGRGGRKRKRNARPDRKRYPGPKGTNHPAPKVKRYATRTTKQSASSPPPLPLGVEAELWSKLRHRRKKEDKKGKKKESKDDDKAEKVADGMSEAISDATSSTARPEVATPGTAPIRGPQDWAQIT
ncbi:hypothetical protein BGX34_006455 [Mortierella sp. NVP85]|nr:hypothetical protein BGX34_006455 [Mortierella sp. NVP85]